MAAGTFTSGASIELSADGPMRAPYTAFFQGGLTFESGKLGILSAAKEVLGQSFSGEGGDFSPCFLMPKLFDMCGWEGPAFMQLSRQMREITPLIHARSLFLSDGLPTDALSPEADQFYRNYLCAQYYREKKIDPSAEK
jgi:hypothetical protein